jgi:hypothetical protein
MMSGLTAAVRACLMTLAFLAAIHMPARAQQQSCPLPGQKTMLVVQMFFGQSIAQHAPVSPQDWTAFLRDVVTPRFPGGFTVYDAAGQWLNPDSHRIAREKTKVLVIAADDSPTVRQQVEDLSRLYRSRFSQRSVGVITSQACAAF